MKRIGVILAIVWMLGGCGKQTEEPCRVVTGVQVEYQQQGEKLTRIYTRQESIGAVMNYLRMLKWFKDEAPQQAGEDLIMQGMSIVPVFGGINEQQ